LPDFDASYQGGNYLLGGYWPTWILSASLALSLPVSCAPFLNDYTRYIPSKTKARSLMVGTGVGMFVGCWIAFIVAAYLMTMFTNLETPFVQGVIEMSPTWFVIAFLLVGLIGGVTQGCFALYGGGLALETLGFGGKRIANTIIISAIGFALVLYIVFIYDLTSFVNAFVTIIIVSVSPWLAINLIGYYFLKGQYSPLQLHESKGGLYWFTNGYNLPSIISWIIAVIVGLLFTSTVIFTGPWVGWVGGTDISFIASAIVGGVLYYLLAKNSMSKINGNYKAGQSATEVI
jgi:purine-cytosine permease-like protein